MTVAHTYEDFFLQLNPEDTVLLTPNQRLSRFIEQQWHAWHQSKGHIGWQSLQCRPYDSFLHQLWEHAQYVARPLQAIPFKLTPHQAAYLWAEIIREDKTGFELIDDQTLVKNAMDARTNLSQWCFDLSSQPIKTDESEIFLRWQKRFEQRCTDKHATDDVGLRNNLLTTISAKIVQRIKKVVFLEFDTLTPWDDQFILRLGSMDVTVESKNFTMDSECHQSAHSTAVEEIHAAALWAKSQIALNKDARVGVVVPDLAQKKSTVERVFSEVFDPEYILNTTPRRTLGFGVSAAEQLRALPLIQSAFTILSINFDVLAPSEILEVLFKPFVNAHGEHAKLLQLFRKLIEKRSELSLYELLVEAKGISLNNDKAFYLVDQLEQFLIVQKANRSISQTYSDWRKVFETQLNIFGWPGERALDSYEYQQWTAWQQMLEEYETLDMLGGPIGLGQALSDLSNYCKRPFHPQTLDSPLQILGLFEAAGMKFDKLWVCGMTDKSWPPAPNPNPFIPVSIQRKLSMPRSSSERELKLAQQLTHRLRCAATNVVFSYSIKDGDTEHGASPLISGLDTLPTVTDEMTPLWRHWQQISVMESVDDRYLPKLARNTRVAGGASVLKNQSDCPFRAAARHRLFAYAVEAHQPGITPRIRGELLHGCLERIWRELKTQKALLELSDSQLQNLIDDAVQASWLSSTRGMKLSPYVKTIEINRSLKLMQQWMTLEKERPNFEVILNEKKVDIDIGPLVLSMRVDRVDRDEEGQVLLIDYKTGRTNIADWFGERPKEPQLPIYSLALQEEVVGVAFGGLHHDKFGYQGVSAKYLSMTGIQTLDKFKRYDGDWPSLLNDWRIHLERLAEAFCMGQADVDPNTANKACDYCDLHNLCRIDMTDAEVANVD